MKGNRRIPQNSPVDADGRESGASVQSIVKSAVTAAQTWMDDEVSKDRIKAQRYMNDEVDIGYEEGTSKVIDTKVRTAVRTAMPSVMKVFLNENYPVEYIPTSPQQAQWIRPANDYVSLEFERKGGYGALRDAMWDALTKKFGIIKTYWYEEEEQEEVELGPINAMQLDFIDQQPQAEIVEMEEVQQEVMHPVMGPIMEEMYSVTVMVTNTKGQMCWESVAPEDFFIDEDATCFKDAYCYGTDTEMFVSDVVEMGVPYDTAVQLSGKGTNDNEEEKIARKNGTGNIDEDHGDPSMRKVRIVECYIRMDLDQTGIARRYRVLCGGNAFKVLEVEPYNGEVFSKFEVDPEPHSFVGKSLAELLFEDQDAGTAMLRGLLNNVALTNNPRTAYDPEKVETEDMLNNEIGGLVRGEDLGNSIMPLTVDFIAGQTLGAMQHFDTKSDAKAGVASVGASLNPDVLQSETAAAVQAVTDPSTNSMEEIVRNIAVGGMTSMWMQTMDAITEHMDEVIDVGMRDGTFQQMNPAQWSSDVNIKVNVGLGTGQPQQKAMAYQQLIGLQMQALQSGAPTGITLDNVRSTVEDTLRLAGIHDISRYWGEIPPPQPPQPQQEGPDPYIMGKQIETEGKIQVEQIRLQSDNQKAVMQMRMKMAELAQNGDLSRDEMLQELWIEAARIQGQYDQNLDVAMIQSAQQANNPTQVG